MDNAARTVGNAEERYLATRQEWHLFDRKSRDIAVAKLTHTTSAFANADGGELAVGISDQGDWRGFDSIEDANNLLRQVSETLRNDYYDFEFLASETSPGFVLLLSIDRHPAVVYSSGNDVYIRNSAQNEKITGERLEALKRSKGDSSYEDTVTNCSESEVENSVTMLDFLLNGKSFSEPADFLRKNGLLTQGRATVAGACLFADTPSDFVPSAAAKIYRYRTSGDAQRAHLDGFPDTIEGPIIEVIKLTEERVQEIVRTIPKLDEEAGLQTIEYPIETLHEILVNAFLHRDYGIRDYVHVRIFDNRVEVDSPGRLHGHVTIENILDERSARNPRIQRLVNKFPDPPNMDIGEGLNTAFEAMEKLRLTPPKIEELSDRVRVTIRHEQLASPASAIMEFARKNGSVNNTEAREVAKIDQERTIRRIFEGLVNAGELRRTGGGRGTRYFPEQAAREPT